MSIINILSLPNKDSNNSFRKRELIENKKPKISTHEVYVSIVLTESVASNLNLKLKHLHDAPTKSNKTNMLLLPEPDKLLSNLSQKPQALLDEFHVDIAFFRSVQMNESSTSVTGEDDLPDQETENVAYSRILEKYSYYLEPFLVRIKSLSAVRSVAHEGNLYINTAGVYVCVYNTQLPSISNEWVNMCRICFGTDSNEHLIGPCSCKGTIALAHFSCLERWLKESARSRCELCQQPFQITRTPKYSVLSSIFVWIYSNANHRKILLQDLLALCLYTPAVVTSTHILMLIFECATQAGLQTNNPSTTIVSFFSVLGIAVIDFTYTSWFLMHFQKHLIAWRSWYRESCCLTLLLPPRKLRRCIIETNDDADLE